MPVEAEGEQSLIQKSPAKTREMQRKAAEMKDFLLREFGTTKVMNVDKNELKKRLG